jgi:hypothetical protein
MWYLFISGLRKIHYAPVEIEKQAHFRRGLQHAASQRECTLNAGFRRTKTERNTAGNADGAGRNAIIQALLDGNQTMESIPSR